MEFMHVKTVLSVLPHVFVGCSLSLVFSYFCDFLSFVALFCHVKCYKMKRFFRRFGPYRGPRRHKTKEISGVR